MPHFRLETNVPQEKIPKDFTKKLCTVLSKCIGKPVTYCAATVIGGVNLSFGGTDEPAAMATLMSIGGLGADKNKSHSRILCKLIEEEIGVSGTRMYIHFVDAAGSDVGYSGVTFG